MRTVSTLTAGGRLADVECPGTGSGRIGALNKRSPSRPSSAASAAIMTYLELPGEDRELREPSVVMTRLRRCPESLSGVYGASTCGWSPPPSAQDAWKSGLPPR